MREAATVPHFDSARARALAWLAHPVSLVAIAVMVVNDHVLKAHFGSWFTGKLSDVAGMVFFPALMAVVLSLVAPRSVAWPRLVGVASAVTGLGFVWVKTSDAGAAAASSLLSAVAGPSLVLKDPSDLLALAAIALAAWVGVRAQGDLRSVARKALATVAVPVAVAASAATSPWEAPQATGVSVEYGIIYAQVGDRYFNEEYGRGPWYPLTGPGVGSGEPVSELLAARLDGRMPLPTEVCLPDDAKTCFRPTPASSGEEGAYGVDISRDGGRTWKPDFAITEAQWQRLADLIPGGYPAEETLVTHAVVVGEVAGETVVVAANGTDGIAVRREDGTWERRGFADATHFADFIPLPDDKVREPHVLVRFWLAVGVTLSCLALVVTGVARAHGWRGWHIAWRAVLLLASLLVAGVAGFLAFVFAGELPGDAVVGVFDTDLMLALFAAVLVPCTALALLALGWFSGRGRWAALWPALVIGFGVVTVIALLSEADVRWVYTHRNGLAFWLTLGLSVVLGLWWLDARVNGARPLPWARGGAGGVGAAVVAGGVGADAGARAGAGGAGDVADAADTADAAHYPPPPTPPLK